MEWYSHRICTCHVPPAVLPICRITLLLVEEWCLLVSGRCHAPSAPEWRLPPDCGFRRPTQRTMNAILDHWLLPCTWGSTQQHFPSRRTWWEMWSCRRCQTPTASYYRLMLSLIQWKMSSICFRPQSWSLFPPTQHLTAPSDKPVHAPEFRQLWVTIMPVCGNWVVPMRSGMQLQPRLPTHVQ